MGDKGRPHGRLCVLFPTSFETQSQRQRKRPLSSDSSSAAAQRSAAAHLLSFFPGIPLTIDDYLTQRAPLQDARWPHVQLLPGVERLVAHLAAHAVPIAIATGSVRHEFRLKTAHLQRVFAHFGENVVCADDGARRGKPFPDVFLAAARKLGRDVGPNDEGDVVGEAEREERAHGLVFEDAIPGVQAGKRAGMDGALYFPFFIIIGPSI